MVAYSFRPRFVEPILAGLEPGPIAPGMKRQTVRADRRRHARPGEDLQLYTGMRTRQCRLIGRARCVAVVPVRLLLMPPFGVWIARDGVWEPVDPEDFARADGFADWAGLVEFWRAEHAGCDRFDGVLIRWGGDHG